MATTPARSRSHVGAAVAGVVAAAALCLSGCSAVAGATAAQSSGADPVPSSVAAPPAASRTPATTTSPTASSASSAPSPAPASSPAPTAAPAPQALKSSPPQRISIASIGVDTSVIPLGLATDGTVEVPDEAHLGNVGWYDGSPSPGQIGPTVLLAHVSWHGRPGAFARLGQLQPGARVEVDRADGIATTWVVTRVDTVAKTSFPTDAVYGDQPTPALRLITCGGSWVGGSLGYDSNVIVYAVPAAG